MPWDDQSTSDRDRARAILGDIDDANELRTDAHYDAMLGLLGFNGGVAFIANSLAAQFAQEPGSVSIPSASGALSVSWKDRVATWLALATAALSGALTGPPSVSPYAGGISRTDKETDEADTDRVVPAFTRALHDDPALAPLTIEDVP